MKTLSFASMRNLAVVAILLFCASSVLAQKHAYPTAAQLAPTPPMGWNSWNHFGGQVNEADVRAAAKAMVSSGMAAAGYKYIIVDDTWQGKRNAQGWIEPNKKFPDMPGLIDYVHSLGLKFGIYSSPGPETCAGYTGSYGHVQQDADTYAKWGVDYLKYDLCSYQQIIKKKIGSDVKENLALHPHVLKPMSAQQMARVEAENLAMQKAAYRKMYDALVAAGRPIVYSLCQYGEDDVWKWGASVGGNLWRTTDDIKDNYARMSTIGFAQAGLAPYAGAGHWNDPDMLEVGNGGMSVDEERTHMSLWALLAAPLIAGNNLADMNPTTLSILTNREVIAVDQDRLAKEGNLVAKGGLLEIWTRPLSGGDKAVGLFNRDTEAHKMTLKLAMVGFGPDAHLRDLWLHKAVEAKNGEYTVVVPAHGVVMLRLSH